MVLDKIQSQFGLGFNPFVKPKDADDASSSEKTLGVGYNHEKHQGKKLALGLEKNADKRPDGISFLKEGALGEDGAVHVRGGRAGAKQNLIA